MKTGIIYLLFVLTCSLSLAAKGKEKKANPGKTHYRISAGIDLYKSFSQKKNSMVMKIGYPVFKGNFFRFGSEISFPREKCTHHLKLSALYSSSLVSDDGLGNNFILQENENRYTYLQFEYQMQRDLFHYELIDFDYAPLLGLDAQLRKIKYNSDLHEKTADINLFAGMRMVPEFGLTNRISLQTGFDSFFYLPYLNIGKLKRWENNTSIEESIYHAFYYRTRFHASVFYHFDAGKKLRLGYRSEHTVGFANEKPLFHINKLIHHRMDRYQNIFVEYCF